MTSLRLLWIAPLLFGLSHCDHAVKPTAKLTPYAYHLALSLTPAAEAKMKTTGDNFVVFAHNKIDLCARLTDLCLHPSSFYFFLFYLLGETSAFFLFS